MVNSYVDFSDFTPRQMDDLNDVENVGVVKQFIDDRYFFDLEPTRQKMANIYLMLSQAALQDDYVQLGQETDINFIEIENVDYYDDKYYEENGYIVSAYLRYDRKYNIYNRQIYNIMGLLGDIGGMYSSLYFLGMLVIGFYNRRLFISAILRNLYQVKVSSPAPPTIPRSWLSCLSRAKKGTLAQQKLPTTFTTIPDVLVDCSQSSCSGNQGVAQPGN